MMLLVAIVNAIFTVVMWNHATDAFNADRHALAWFLIAASAANGASVAAYFF